MEQFQKKGWFILDLIDPQPVFEARSALQKKLKELLGPTLSLEQYHTVAEDDVTHTATQVAMTQFFRENRFGPRIMAAQAPFFQKMVGLDLKIQSNPYLRMTRPHKLQDNIGYHRDTFYGGSPFELSVLIPFVDLPKESSLSVFSGSHVFSEKMFPTTQMENPDTAVRKGSAKHQLGFLYAPKLMDKEIEKNMEPIALKVGQALVFSLSTVHGSVVNAGNVTRWSIDTRVMNALAPVDLSARPDYYETLCHCPVTAAAKEYFKANE